MERLYGDMIRLAQSLLKGERKDHTLQPEAMVHEIYVRLMHAKNIPWQTGGDFLLSVLFQMRRLLVDYARAHKARPQGKASPIEQAIENPATTVVPENIEAYLTLCQALRDFSRLDPNVAPIVGMRFLGYSFAEISRSLEVDESKVKREWRLVSSFLQNRLLKAGVR